MREDLFATNSRLVIEARAAFAAGRYSYSATLWEALAENAEYLRDTNTAASAWGAAAAARRRAGQFDLAKLDDGHARGGRDPGVAR